MVNKLVYSNFRIALLRLVEASGGVTGRGVVAGDDAISDSNDAMSVFGDVRLVRDQNNGVAAGV